MRAGAVKARGSRRLTVALANPPSPRPKHGGAGGGDRLTASGVLALVVVVLAGIGVVSTLRKLGRRKRRRGQPRAQATAGHPASASGEDTSGRNGATRAGLKASAPAPGAPDRYDVRRVLRRVTFSKHAIERFVDRADIPLTSYRQVDLLIRDLLEEEGEVKTERPLWSQSTNTAGPVPAGGQVDAFRPAAELLAAMAMVGLYVRHGRQRTGGQDVGENALQPRLHPHAAGSSKPQLRPVRGHAQPDSGRRASRVASRAWFSLGRLTCAGGPCQAHGPGLIVGIAVWCRGGAWAWLVVRGVCARAPSLTSVHDPRVGSGAGDKMFDGGKRRDKPAWSRR